MRIVFISSATYADCDFPLLREWNKQGYDVYYFMDLPCYSMRSTIINIAKQIPESGILDAMKYKELQMFQSYLNLKHFYVINRLNKTAFSFGNIIAQLDLVRRIAKINPDKIIIAGQLEFFGFMLYVFRKKIVMTVHDPFPHSGEKTFRKMFFRKIAFKLIPNFVLLNGRQKEEFKEYWHLRDNQICVNHLGPYDCTNLFLSKNDEKKERNTGYNILFFGRISKYKGIEYLLKAMTIVHEQIPEATVTIAGRGQMYFDISPYKDLPYVEIANRFIDITELANLLYKCSLVVCPYTDASQSGVVLTAFAMNKPVIASNVGAMAEYIENGKTGVLVPPKDVQPLANALIDILGNKNKLSEMVKNIKERNLSDTNGWKGIARKYIQFYKNK